MKYQNQTPFLIIPDRKFENAAIEANFGILLYLTLIRVIYVYFSEGLAVIPLSTTQFFREMPSCRATRPVVMSKHTKFCVKAVRLSHFYPAAFFVVVFFFVRLLSAKTVIFFIILP